MSKELTSRPRFRSADDDSWAFLEERCLPLRSGRWSQGQLLRLPHRPAASALLAATPVADAHAPAVTTVARIIVNSCKVRPAGPSKVLQIGMVVVGSISAVIG